MISQHDAIIASAQRTATAASINVRKISIKLKRSYICMYVYKEATY